MAPEVCTTARASYKSDIWSLGITAIELAENRLPHAQLNHAMRIMRAITTSPSPTLSGGSGKRWSAAFHSFVNTCLAKDPAQRPDAFELLEHPFLRTRDASITATSPSAKAFASASGPALLPVSTRTVLKPLIDKFFAEKARLEREELEGEGEDEEQE
jgi:serine/threonine protein kinase